MSDPLEAVETIPPPSSNIFSGKAWFLVVLIIWFAAIYWITKGHFANGADMAATLLAAASLAIFVFSIFIALLAIFGWQTVIGVVQATAKNEAKKAVSIAMRSAQKEIDKIKPMAEARINLETELRGRTLTILGFIIGESSLNPETKSPVDERARENLAEAINLCKQGHEHLKKLTGAPKYMGLNNLVFYSCAYGVEGDARKTIIKQARELMEVGERHAAYNLILTYCRVILEHGTDPEEKIEARSRLRRLLTEGNLSPRETREARIYLSRFEAETETAADC